jgi:hypothetical protein
MSKFPVATSGHGCPFKVVLCRLALFFNCPVLAIVFWLFNPIFFCPGCTVQSRLSFLAVQSQLFCSSCPVFAVLSWLCCCLSFPAFSPSYPISGVLSQLSFSICLSQTFLPPTQFFPRCLVLAVMFWSSFSCPFYPGCPVLAVLSPISYFRGPACCPVLTVQSFPAYTKLKN